jgi:regulator of cell morphogenesis and NO signaling
MTMNEESTVGQTDTSDERWEQASLDDLIAHILTTYHQPLREELPRLESMARKLSEEQPEEDTDTLSELLSTYLGLMAELEDHMMKEEQILFPMILQGQGGMAAGPISVMEMEHESAKSALADLRRLAGNYELTAEATDSRRALWNGLAALEDALHQHIHLENNILFPRVRAS